MAERKTRKEDADSHNGEEPEVESCYGSDGGLQGRADYLETRGGHASIPTSWAAVLEDASKIPQDSYRDVFKTGGGDETCEGRIGRGDVDERMTCGQLLQSVTDAIPGVGVVVCSPQPSSSMTQASATVNPCRSEQLSLCCFLRHGMQDNVRGVCAPLCVCTQYWVCY